MDEAEMEQLFASVSECCEALAIGRTKFYQLVASGKITVRKIGKKTLVPITEVRQWAAQLPHLEAESTVQPNRDSDSFSRETDQRPETVI
jgi:excisionase family DNA binding protein